MKLLANGIQLNVRTSGDGPPLLLIHGYPLNSAMWQPQLDGLSEDASVTAPDLRGHGESQIISGPYSMDLMADDCAAILEARGINGPVIIGGLSMGGYVAFAFYRRFAGRVRGLILAATRAGADSPEGKKGRDRAASTAQSEGAGAIVDAMLPKLLAPDTYTSNPEIVRQAREIMEKNSLESILGDLLGMRDRDDSSSALRTIEVPTLILHGAEDQIFPVAEAQAMHEAIPHSELVVIPQSGHLLNLEQPERFNEAARIFLRSLPTIE
jgi:pimeloyl-ACP methyl ester carboxylesterase